METEVFSANRFPDHVTALTYTGDNAQLLMASGWLDGTTKGDDRNGEGPSVLIGLVGSQRVYPGDVIVKDDEGMIAGYHPDVFRRNFEKEPRRCQPRARSVQRNTNRSGTVHRGRRRRRR
jgi:hypothetical protein